MEQIRYETIPTSAYWLNGCNRDSQRFIRRETSPTTIAKSSTTCKYWINGNCIYGDRCRKLHSWSNSGKQNVVKEGNLRPRKLIWWTAPCEGFVKINCDGAFTVHGNKGGAGGVVRDWEGKFIFGFSSGLKNSSAMMAELRAIKIGMETTIAKGFKNLIVESDSKVAIEIITSGVAEERKCDDGGLNVISSIIELSKKADHIYWNHVFREVNSAADGLAKHGLSLSPDSGVKVFDYPPYFIQSHLSENRIGKVYVR